MDGAHRPLRLLQARFSLGSHHQDQEELLLLPRQLHDSARTRPRRLPNLPPVLPPHPPLPPRRLALPLHLPPLRPAPGGDGPDLLGPGNPRDLDARDRGRRLPDKRGVAAHLGDHGRRGDCVRPRRV
ncbi:unnamed protein product [Linum tenue]|uniref:Uncharacterized protein n=1 Tax=Linum tenue TaxID=586396 RepID=A0AAV0IQ52_9ROSI|nr:unnamed protein product [Linum tenue]